MEICGGKYTFCLCLENQPASLPLKDTFGSWEGNGQWWTPARAQAPVGVSVEIGPGCGEKAYCGLCLRVTYTVKGKAYGPIPFWGCECCTDQCSTNTFWLCPCPFPGSPGVLLQFYSDKKSGPGLCCDCEQRLVRSVGADGVTVTKKDGEHSPLQMERP